MAFLPSLRPSSNVASLVPSSAPAVQAEYTATRVFGEPLEAQAVVVQRDSRGLPPSALQAAVRNAVSIDTGRATGAQISGLAGALPIPNTDAIFPASRERSTTVLTYLYFRPSTSPADQLAGSVAYASRYASAPGDGLVGVTGAGLATYEQGVIISQHVVWVEIATVLAIAVIVGFFFLSLGAPVATLACAATAFLVAIRVVAWVMQQMHVTLPPDVEPVLVVLLLGVTTDYSVFFASGMRNRLAEGMSKIQAARLTTAEFSPIILAAGLLVAAGTASLGVARMQLIRAFGPALAVTVLTAMVVSLTLAPALIAIFGSALFWPGPRWLRTSRKAVQHAAKAQAAGEPPTRAPRPSWQMRVTMARVLCGLTVGADTGPALCGLALARPWPALAVPETRDATADGCDATPATAPGQRRRQATAPNSRLGGPVWPARPRRPGRRSADHC